MSEISNKDQYLETSKAFGSLFIVCTEGASDTRCVCEVANVNNGLSQFSLVPLDEEALPFEKGQSISVLNETGNISFRSLVLLVHGRKMVTAEVPMKISLVNLRQDPRKVIEEKELCPNPTISSLGPDGLKVLTTFDVAVSDVSQTGIGLEINVRRLDSLFRDDIVELKISSTIPSLAKVKGRVVHKSIQNVESPEKRKYRIGVQFLEKIKL